MYIATQLDRNPMAETGASLRAATTMASLAALESAGIEHCVLRNHDRLHEEPGRDVDMAAHDADISRIADVLGQVRLSFGWDHLVRCTGHHEGTSFYFLNQSGCVIEQLELHFTRVRWAGLSLVSTENLLRDRTLAANGVWVASESHMAAQRVLQFGFSGQISEMKKEYWDETFAYVSAHQQSFTLDLAEALGDEKVADRVVNSLLANDRGSVAELMRKQRAAFGLTHVLRSRESAIGVLRRLWDRVGAASARCGVVAITTEPEFAARVSSAIDTMFLTVGVVYGPVERSLRKHTARRVSKAGAAIIVTPHPEFEFSNREWGGSSVVLESDLNEACGQVVGRFIDNH